MAMEKRFVGWRYFALVGGLVGMIGLAMYPIAIDPYLHPEKYRAIQQQAGLDKASRKKMKKAAYEAVGDKDAWKNPKYRDAIREKEATLEE
ncbi:hypothetical protein NP493_652g01030 [Ridgeia piscesae]|uniref:Uncharacterized protein n=1 Tax=Ridgeia piscesae TaxID=27915 RepID=A0AAD9NRB0_RIDPI|nr:hypothetical protein NP493_652g01030 [Ridgeia piscesae]